jgi:type II secretory pathway component PulK
MERVGILLVVLGILCLVISGIILALSYGHTADVRARLTRLSIGYAAGGSGILLVHLLAFTLQDWRRERDTVRRRRGDYSNMVVAPMTPNTRRDAREGMVLIYVLVLVGLIAALVMQAQVAARRALQAAESRLVAGDLRRAATDAAMTALHRIADDERLDVDSTNDAWAVTERVTTPAGVATEVAVTDLDRFFDLNNLQVAAGPGTRPADEIVADLFIQCGQFAPSALIDAMRDWIDADQEGMRETSFYARKTPPYIPPDRAAYAWSELLAVEGASRDAFTRPARMSTIDAFKMDFADCAAILPVKRDRPMTINLNTATRGALLGVFGLAQERLVNTIIVLRALKPIVTIDSISHAADPLVFESVRPYLEIKSSFFRIDVSARRDDHVVTVRAVARRSDKGAVDVLQWLY